MVRYAEAEVAFDRARAMTVEAACPHIHGRAGRAAHPDTVRRYMTKGARVPGGQRVKLRSVKVGGERFTMPEWVELFERQRLLGGAG